MNVDALLSDDDPPVFAVEGLDARSPFVVACDHGGRRIPRRLADLGLSEQELSTHVAWDLGVAELGRRLAARLDAFLIVHSYSRLVIDANRPPGAPDSIVTLSECTRVVANEGLAPRDVRRRLEELFEPYHARLRDELDARVTRRLPSVLVALHTFTPVYMGEKRPWHIGVLYGRDSRLAQPILAALRRDKTFVVGDNEPYAASDATDHTIVVHGERRGIAHVELEVRQDLLTDDTEMDKWADYLGRILEEAITHVLPQDPLPDRLSPDTRLSATS